VREHQVESSTPAHTIVSPFELNGIDRDKTTTQLRTSGGGLGGFNMNRLNSTSVKVKVVKIYTTYVCMMVKFYLESLIGPATRA